MQRANAQVWIEKLKSKWVLLLVFSNAIISISITLVLFSLLLHFFQASYWLLALLFLIVTAICFLVKPSWTITKNEIARYANEKFPQLEESAGLLLQQRSKLSLLQQLQFDKVEQIICSVNPLDDLLKKLYRGLGILIVAFLTSYLLAKSAKSVKHDQTTVQFTSEKGSIAEAIPPAIKDFELTIIPPSYIGKSSRKQQQFTIRAEVGAQVQWKIRTSAAVKKLKLIFNDREIYSLKAKKEDLTLFIYHKIINKSGFYQIEINGEKSDLFQIELIPDLPVKIRILKPAKHTTIDIGQPKKIDLNAVLNDDYGIAEAHLSATMASGKGEGVSFTEKKVDFGIRLSGQKNVVLSKQIDLNVLGMKPGDELYFFIKATDNHGQSSRSDIYFVSIVDTVELMSLSGMANGVSLVPEYFRSQRQIIIDTEKLLKDQLTLTTAAFNTRANELGIDQKLLRLRYGKFLGEEDETEIGGDHENHDEPGHQDNGEKFGDASAIMDKYAHKHDIAEDATFFEPALKAQLKAVLTEMWKSELRLRTYKPQEALPFEYKALRLLKDLQQKSRAYVAKTIVKKTALKPEKRLSGELQQITQPITTMSVEQKEQRTTHLKNTLSVLEKGKSGKKFNNEDRNVLNLTEKYMIGAAADHPGIYLEALTQLRRIAGHAKVDLKHFDLLQTAIQKMIGPEQVKPQAKDISDASSLYNGYFDHLKKGGR